MKLLQQFSLAQRYKERAEAAEKLCEQQKQALIEADALLVKLSDQIKDKPVLISIERTGRMNRFGFARHGKAFYIETLGSWSDDVSQWKRDLLGKTDG